MNTTAFSGIAEQWQDRSPSTQPHLVVQILSVIAFGIFSIVGIALAFSAHWLAGLLLAGMIAKTWAGSLTFSGGHSCAKSRKTPTIDDLAPAVSDKRSSGNASFDAYRGEMLQRLERESRDFDDFLVRLRKASDAREFDKFMNDRAALARQIDTADHDDT